MPFRLLCVTAHPDDESGAFGGALLMAHRDGVETSLLCLTDGQAAHHRGDAADSAELGRMRSAELAAACEVLGVTRCEVLHYPDGDCRGRISMRSLVIIVEHIRSLRPQVVLTFPGDGGVNLHRDHTMVSMPLPQRPFTGRDGRSSSLRMGAAFSLMRRRSSTTRIHRSSTFETGPSYRNLRLCPIRLLLSWATCLK